MAKELEANANWIAREEGRIPTKGAQAAERASAGLGATDHDAELLSELLSLQAVTAGWPRNARCAAPCSESKRPFTGSRRGKQRVS